MKNAVLVVLVAAAAALLSIVGLTGYIAVRRAHDINEEIVRINSKSRETERNLEGLLAELDTTRIYIRDYMLDPFGEPEELTSSRFLELKVTIDKRLRALSDLLGPEEATAITNLQMGLNGYFDSLLPILEAGPRGFPGGTRGFRGEMTSRREAVVSLAQKVAEIDKRRFTRGTADIEKARLSYSSYMWKMTAAGLLLGGVISFLGGHRITVLQRRARSHELEMERTQMELRRLSAEHVREQEEERKAISRELHDEVGQTVTALGIEIGNIERLGKQSGPEFMERVAEAKQLTQGVLRSVRDMAMGLRPSMLDDSGLVPALRWQARDFAKRVGVPVDVQIDGSLDRLPDEMRTCIYRIVQEALTNCARHANAQNIRIALHGDDDGVSVAIQDDGIGFNPYAEAGGLGIVGIEERARELGGTLKISSENERGTLLRVEIPLKTHP
jgi:signal transduction histidine kinase